MTKYLLIGLLLLAGCDYELQHHRNAIKDCKDACASLGAHLVYVEITTPGNRPDSCTCAIGGE